MVDEHPSLEPPGALVLSSIIAASFRRPSAQLPALAEQSA